MQITDEELKKIEEENEEFLEPLMKQLKSQDLLVNVFGTESKEFTKLFNIIIRHANTQMLIMQKSEFYNNNTFYFSNKTLSIEDKKYGFHSNHQRVDYITDLTSYLLSSLELGKKFLQNILNTEKMELKPTATYGTILRRIEIALKREDVTEFFRLQLRNDLGHEDWVITEDFDGIYYYDKSNQKRKISLKELERLSYVTYNIQAKILIKYSQMFHPKPDSVINVNQIFSPKIEPITEEKTLPDFKKLS